MFLSLIFHSKSCIQNCLNSSIRDTVLVTTATITSSNIFFLSQGSSHNNIVKLQSDNIRDKKIIFLVLDPLNTITSNKRLVYDYKRGRNFDDLRKRLLDMDICHLMTNNGTDTTIDDDWSIWKSKCVDSCKRIYPHETCKPTTFTHWTVSKLEW